MEETDTAFALQKFGNGKVDIVSVNIQPVAFDGVFDQFFRFFDSDKDTFIIFCPLDGFHRELFAVDPGEEFAQILRGGKISAAVIDGTWIAKFKCGKEK